jgi:hypothetical protein
MAEVEIKARENDDGIHSKIGFRPAGRAVAEGRVE